MSKLRAAIAQGSRSATRKLVTAGDLLDQYWRRVLVALGTPIAPPYLTLRGSWKGDFCGLFSEFAAVLGLLELYEARPEIYAGLEVDFDDQGLYYEPEQGKNWWEYYFQPIALGHRNGTRSRIVNAIQHEALACTIDLLSRARGAELIGRYIRPKPHILEMANAYARANFDDAHVIGVHYRGTDKHEEAPRVPYERVQAAVLEALRSASALPCKVFVATDEQAFLDFMRERFRGELLYREMFRSVDGQPIHRRGGDNHAKGLDAVLDCLLLARCRYLVRTTSNLSLCSTFFNSSMPTMLLKQPR